MSLAGVTPGTRCRVTAIRPATRFAYRLMELGFIEGAELDVLCRAPLGDPMRIRVGGSHLSLRSAEAEMIEVTPV